MSFQNLSNSFAFANTRFNLMKRGQGAEKAHKVCHTLSSAGKFV